MSGHPRQGLKDGFWVHIFEMEMPGEGQVWGGHTKIEILMRQLSGSIKYTLGDANLELQGDVVVGVICVGESA